MIIHVPLQELLLLQELLHQLSKCCGSPASAAPSRTARTHKSPAALNATQAPDAHRSGPHTHNGERRVCPVQVNNKAPVEDHLTNYQTSTSQCEAEDEQVLL